MNFTITRTFAGASQEWLTLDGSFKVNPPKDQIQVFHQLEQALDATIALQVKHDLATSKSPCTYSLNRPEVAAV